MVADTFRNLVASEAIARYFAGVLRPFLRPIKRHKVRNFGGMVFEADDCPEAMLRKLFILLDSVEVGAVHLPACNVPPHVRCRRRIVRRDFASRLRR